MTKIFSYVVARDYGFAPNPFYGCCSLATCKPIIRKTAIVGDWVIGTGSRKYGLDGTLVYIMEVSEITTFNQYWTDKRFENKRPMLNGSLKQAFGDNIYYRDSQYGKWIQVNSHHSFKDGKPNPQNIRHDTEVDRVLISFNYAYWGGNGPKIPRRFRNPREDICQMGQGHKCRFSNKFLEITLCWLYTLPRGYLGNPSEFTKYHKITQI